MNKIDRDKTIQILKNKTKEMTERPEKALDFLVRTGIYNKDGSLTKEYKTK